MLFPYFGRRPKTGIQNLSDKETGCRRPCLQNMGSPDIFKEIVMNQRQQKVRMSKMNQRDLDLRNQFWPNLDPDQIWDRKKATGFTTIPRTIPHFLRIMDYLAPKGKPISSTYLALWCRSFDQYVLTIDNPKELAFESGFGGSRMESPWRGRMKILQELEFIDSKPGPSSPFNYVIIYNPYRVIKRLHEGGKLREEDFNALFVRSQNIGTKELH